MSNLMHLGKSKSEDAKCRSCTSFSEYMKESKKRYLSDRKKGGILDSDNFNPDYPMRDDCPVDKSVLGKSSWIYLHTMAAHYPENPSVSDQKDMCKFFKLFAKFYPCTECRDDFITEVNKHPPRAESQEELSQWLCRLHNSVNVKIGKDKFDCRKVNERWRDGWLDGSCDY